MTPQEALRQCVEAMKMVDFHDCHASEELWHSFNAAQQVAEEVLKRPEQEPTAYIRACGLDNLKAGRTAVVYPCYTDSDQSFCLYAAPVAAQQAVAAVPDAILARTEEIRQMMADPTGIPRGTLEWMTECLLAHIALTNAAPHPAAAPSGDVERLSALKIARAALKTADSAIKGREHTGFIHNAIAVIDAATKE